MNLFSQLEVEPTHEELYPGAVLMRGLALAQDAEFFAAVERILAAAPLRHATTPSGLPMSVMVTDCGHRRWGQVGPETAGSGPRCGRRFRGCWRSLRCGARCGRDFRSFSRMRCTSIATRRGRSWGCTRTGTRSILASRLCRFRWGWSVFFCWAGLERTDKAKRILLEHGDVIVWGGPSRMRFHGVLPLKPGWHPMTGPYRFNLTFRTTCGGAGV